MDICELLVEVLARVSSLLEQNLRLLCGHVHLTQHE